MTDSQATAAGPEARTPPSCSTIALVVDLIELTLNHGVFVVRAARNLAEAEAILADWHPHMAVVDMDHDDSTALLQRLGASNTPDPERDTRPWPHSPGRPEDEAPGLRPGRRRHPDDAVLAGGAAGPRRSSSRRRATGDRPAHHPDHHDSARSEIDILNREVRAGDSVVHLSGIEQSLLYLLASRAGRVVTRDEILDAIWGTDFVAESNIVDRHVRSLRDQAPERLPPSALHRHGPRQGLPLHPHLLEPRLGERAGEMTFRHDGDAPASHIPASGAPGLAHCRNFLPPTRWACLWGMGPPSFARRRRLGGPEGSFEAMTGRHRALGRRETSAAYLAITPPA